MRRKQKNGAPVRWAVKDAVTGRVVRDDDGRPVTVTAYTEKSARHQAKTAHGTAVIVERAP